MISPPNTSPALTSTNTEAGAAWRPGYCRITLNDRFQGLLGGQYAFRILGSRKVAAIHDGGAYTESLTGMLSKTFVNLGGEAVFPGSANVFESGYFRCNVSLIDAIKILRPRYAWRQRH